MLEGAISDQDYDVFTANIKSHPENDKDFYDTLHSSIIDYVYKYLHPVSDASSKQRSAIDGYLTKIGYRCLNIKQGAPAQDLQNYFENLYPSGKGKLNPNSTIYMVKTQPYIIRFSGEGIYTLKGNASFLN